MKTSKGIKLSVVIPVYNEENNLPELYNRLAKVFSNDLKISHEIVFIDDGSTDNSWRVVEEFHRTNKKVRGIKLSKNFGHDLAIKSGIDHCAGSAAICMDSDLQHSPELIPSIYARLAENDIVFLRRISNESESALRTIANKWYYYVFKKFTGIDIPSGVSDFFAVNKKVIETIKRFNEKSYFNRGILLSLGYKRILMDYKADKRFSGSSKYTLKDLIRLSIKGLVNFSALPLKFVVYVGLFFSFLSFAYGIYSVVKTVLIGSIAGWASLIATTSFLNGFIILILAVYLEYFIVIFNEIKERPAYLVDEIL